MAAPDDIPPPFPTQRRWLVVLLTVASLIAATGATALFATNPAGSRLFPPCPFHSVTGLYCPGCGSTRAAHHLLHGRVATAFDFNALMVVSLPFLLYAGVLGALRLAGRTAHRPPLSQRLPGWAVWALLVVVLLFGVLRNLPYRPVRWMAP